MPLFGLTHVNVTFLLGPALEVDNVGLAGVLGMLNSDLSVAYPDSGELNPSCVPIVITLKYYESPLVLEPVTTLDPYVFDVTTFAPYALNAPLYVAQL